MHYITSNRGHFFQPSSLIDWREDGSGISHHLKNWSRLLQRKSITFLTHQATSSKVVRATDNWQQRPSSSTPLELRPCLQTSCLLLLVHQKSRDGKITTKSDFCALPLAAPTDKLRLTPARKKAYQSGKRPKVLHFDTDLLRLKPPLHPGYSIFITFVQLCLAIRGKLQMPRDWSSKTTISDIFVLRPDKSWSDTSKKETTKKMTHCTPAKQRLFFTIYHFMAHNVTCNICILKSS